MTNYLTTYRGTLASATVGEIFVHTLAVTSTLNQAAVATAVRDAWQTAWNAASGLKSAHPNQVKYTEATAATILDLSKGDLSAATHASFSPQPVGGGVSMTPTQLAVCISLVGGPRANGTPYRGRFYLPPPDYSYLEPTSGKFSSAYHFTDGVKAFMDLLSIAGILPCVWSRSASVLSPVVNIKVGDRPDTIRRRRNSAGETYVTNVP